MKHIRALLLAALTLASLAGYGQTGSTITYPSSGRAATEAWVQEYIFDQLEKYVKADCDLVVNQIVKDGNAFEFGVTVSLPNVTQYTIKIQKGDQKWFWYNVPYATGSRIRIQNVPAQDSLRVTIRPTQFPTCYVSFRLDGTIDPSPEPDPDPNPNPSDIPCTTAPSITSTTLPQPGGVRAVIAAPGVTNYNWFVALASAPNTVLRSGNKTTAGTVDFAWGESLPNGIYQLKIQSVNCAGVATRNFTINETAPPIANCTAGPAIISVYNVLSTGLTTQFHGVNVSQIKYIVKDATGASVRTGNISPTSSVLNITFSSAIAPGDYTLRLEGVNCTGFSEKTFTLSGGGGGTDPPVPSGTIVPKFVTQGFPEHMSIVVNGTGSSKTLTDVATVSPPAGYEFRYYINDQLIKQTGRLINFPWPSDVPVTIYKMQIRPDVGNVLIWGFDEGWKDPNAGKVFSYNTTCAYAAILFDDATSGYNASKKTVQWMDFLPDMPATDDKIWIMPRGTINTPEQLFAKGVTDLSGYSLLGLTTQQINDIANSGRSYDEAVKTPQQLNLPDRGTGQWVPPGQNWPNVWNTQFFDYTPGQTVPLTDQQWADKGNQYFPMHRITIFENMENVHALSPHWSGWRLYYQNLVAKAQARFPNRWRMAHNYFTGALNQYCESCPQDETKRNLYGVRPGILGTSSRAQHKAFLSSAISQWPQSNILPGGNMEMLNSACYSLYINSIDDSRDNAYRMIYSGYLTHKAGKYDIVFSPSTYEWHPNNLKEVVMPTGKFYYHEKMPISLAQLVNYAFISRAFMDGFISWASLPKGDGDFKFAKEYTMGELWYPNGSTTPQSSTSFPAWTKPGEAYQYPSNGFEDAVARGMYLYSQTWMPTSGGTQSFLRYRLNGGAWVEPLNTNLHDVVDAFVDKRAIVMGQVKNGKLSVMYLDPYANGTVKTLEYQYNGVTYPAMQVSSMMVHAKIHNL